MYLYIYKHNKKFYWQLIDNSRRVICKGTKCYATLRNAKVAITKIHKSLQVLV